MLHNVTNVITSEITYFVRLRFYNFNKRISVNVIQYSRETITYMARQHQCHNFNGAICFAGWLFTSTVIDPFENDMTKFELYTR